MQTQTQESNDTVRN